MLRKAQKRDRRFVPLYRLQSGAAEPNQKSPRTTEMVVEVVEQQMVLASTTLKKYLKPGSSLPNLRSRVTSRKMTRWDTWCSQTRAWQNANKHVYMPALQTRCKALHISPFGRMEDMLARAHTAADNAGLHIFVARESCFPSLQDLNELIEQVADAAAL